MRPASSQAEILAAAITSGYRPMRRLLLFAFAFVFDTGAGVIPPGGQPSLTELAHMTGMHRASVKRHLNWLEKAEPVRVQRDRPPAADARRFHFRTAYTVLVPDGLGAGNAWPGRAPPHGLGARHTGLGANSAVPGRSVPRGLGAATAAQIEEDDSSVRVWERPAVIAAALEELGAAGWQITEAEAGVIARQVLAGREIRTTPENYLRSSLRKTPRLYVPARFTSGPPPARHTETPPAEKLSREEIRAAMERGTTTDDKS